jgi:hypothetical protein
LKTATKTQNAQKGQVIFILRGDRKAWKTALFITLQGSIPVLENRSLQSDIGHLIL